MKPAREPASSRPKPCASLKKPHESCRGQASDIPSKTSRFKPVILAHRGSALPWLVDDRAALRLRRICIVLYSKIYGRVYVFPFRDDVFLPCGCDQELEFYINIFSLSLGNEQADAGPDGRTRLARPNSQARTGTDSKIFKFSAQLTTSRIGNLTRG